MKYLKSISIAIVWMAMQTASVACPVCERQKEGKPFKAITHGIGPDSNWDYLTVVVAIIITLLTLFYAVKWLIKPGEKSKNHIKYTVLNIEE